jgi:6-phosphogluconolactonase
MVVLGTRMTAPVVDVCTDPTDLAARAGDLIIQAASDAISQRGRFTLVLAGGSAPENTYALLSQADRASAIDWAHVYVFFGDERFVPVGDPRSNYGMARRSLLARVPIPASNVFPMPTEARNAAEGAAEYARLLAEFFSVSERTTPPRFDLIILGLGRDGHTASLFPYAKALEVTDAWVTWSPPGRLPPPVDRITLTYPVLNSARQVAFLVFGMDKAPALHDVLEGQASCEDRPAAGVQPVDGGLIWFIDKQAAQLLTQPH